MRDKQLICVIIEVLLSISQILATMNIIYLSQPQLKLNEVT